MHLYYNGEEVAKGKAVCVDNDGCYRFTDSDNKLHYLVNGEEVSYKEYCEVVSNIYKKKRPEYYDTTRSNP